MWLGVLKVWSLLKMSLGHISNAVRCDLKQMSCPRKKYFFLRARERESESLVSRKKTQKPVKSIQFCIFKVPNNFQPLTTSEWHFFQGVFVEVTAHGANQKGPQHARQILLRQLIDCIFGHLGDHWVPEESAMSQLIFYRPLDQNIPTVNNIWLHNGVLIIKLDNICCMWCIIEQLWFCAHDDVSHVPPQQSQAAGSSPALWWIHGPWSSAFQMFTAKPISQMITRMNMFVDMLILLKTCLRILVETFWEGEYFWLTTHVICQDAAWSPNSTLPESSHWCRMKRGKTRGE